LAAETPPNDEFSSDEYDLTVVVACVEAARTIDRCLDALERTCADIRAQVVVAVDGSMSHTVARLRDSRPAIEILQYPAGTLVPSLWAAGLHVAQGRAVAFTLGQMVVSETWARGLLRGLRRSHGVGGPLMLARDVGITDAAVFFLRYSAFLPAMMPEGLVAGEIAGDNAAYRREPLDQYRPSVNEGFWEVDFHRRLRASGFTLGATAEATSMFCGGTRFSEIARHRYEHGHLFGRARVQRGETRLRILTAAPLVPFALAWRAARRVSRQPALRLRFALSLPIFLALAGCWAAGEARGAVQRHAGGC
jgi:hypothetical protein